MTTPSPAVCEVCGYTLNVNCPRCCTPPPAVSEETVASEGKCGGTGLILEHPDEPFSQSLAAIDKCPGCVDCAPAVAEKPKELLKDNYGTSKVRRALADAMAPHTGMHVGPPKVVIDASHVAHMFAQFDAIRASLNSPAVDGVVISRIIAEQALIALESSYDAREWPADGTSKQEIAAAALRAALAGEQQK